MILQRFNAVRAKEGCVDWIRQWFKYNGDGCNAIVGISGGKDSSVVAALCVEALGKDRVIGVLMPRGKQQDIQDSYDLVDTLHIKHVNINIESAINGIYYSIRDNNFLYKDDAIHIELSEQAEINLPPRIRMATLYAVSQSCNGRVANTCNLSEDYIGYSTRWGDSVGDFAPIAGFTCSEVIQIGETLGLPDHLIHKTPSDGLCGKSDEDSFGFTYEVLDRYIRENMCDNLEIKEKIDRMRGKNLFKLQMPPRFVPYWESGIFETIIF